MRYRYTFLLRVILKIIAVQKLHLQVFASHTVLQSPMSKRGDRNDFSVGQCERPCYGLPIVTHHKTHSMPAHEVGICESKDASAKYN